ncbi:MAG: hypothetical protein ACFFEF_08055 [Candidatus Thorarchaeota archaeon]
MNHNRYFGTGLILLIFVLIIQFFAYIALFPPLDPLAIFILVCGAFAGCLFVLWGLHLEHLERVNFTLISSGYILLVISSLPWWFLSHTPLYGLAFLAGTILIMIGGVRQKNKDLIDEP